MKIHQKFECEKCRTTYTMQALAEACEAQVIEQPIAKVGDIVIAGAGYGWFTGDPTWVSNYERLAPLRTGAADHMLNRLDKRWKCPQRDTNCFGPCCTYAFYYVVGTVEHRSYDRDEREPCNRGPFQHEWMYHLFSRAMKGVKEGWTTPRGHIMPMIVVPQPILDGAQAFIGKRTGTLL